jgi:hypothetical protein
MESAEYAASKENVEEVTQTQRPAYGRREVFRETPVEVRGLTRLLSDAAARHQGLTLAHFKAQLEAGHTA